MNQLAHHRTLVPDLTGRSAAAQFWEEHEQLERDNMLLRDENSSINEQLIQTTNMVELVKRENDQLRRELGHERSRANTWLGFVMSLSGRFAAIRSTIESAELVAREAAKAAAERGLVDANDDPHDQQKLAAVVSNMSDRVGPPTVRATTPPQNQLVQT